MHYIFSSPLIPGRLVRRYKRFLAEVELENGEIMLAHCPNPGAMRGLVYEKARVWLEKKHEHGAISKGAKLKYVWQLGYDEDNGALVGANPNLANPIAQAAITQGDIPVFRNYSWLDFSQSAANTAISTTISTFENSAKESEHNNSHAIEHKKAILKREVKYGNNSRIDFLVTLPDMTECYIEIKNVHWRRYDIEKQLDYAAFPDSVTKRGAKHMQELINLTSTHDPLKKEQNHKERPPPKTRAIVIYIVQRDDCQALSFAADIDPLYAQMSKQAQLNGVEIMAFCCSVSPEGIRLIKPMVVL